jgi:transcriptional regulator with XRE-family HTH domain
MLFSRNKIRSDKENLAERIKMAREDKGLSLEDVAKKIGVGLNHLQDIEAGRFDKLPGGVYKKTFIKKYSSFLGLKNVDQISQSVNDKTDVFTRKSINKTSFLVFPKLFRNILAIMAVLTLFLYIGLYLRNSLSMPEIEIFEPVDNLITEKNLVTVSGKADAKTTIEINDHPVLKNENGDFKEIIELKQGLNVISISAQNKYSQKRVIKKQILVK